MKVANEKKPIEYFLKANYPITIYSEPGGGYVAEIEDLPGCLTEGETVVEALEKIRDARQAWIESAYEDGIDIPLPRTDQEYSGKFIVRLTKSLHRLLSEQAKAEGVSLNQYVETLLSAATAKRNTVDDLVVYIMEHAGMAAFLRTSGSVYSIGKEQKTEAWTWGAAHIHESRKQEIAA